MRRIVINMNEIFKKGRPLSEGERLFLKIFLRRKIIRNSGHPYRFQRAFRIRAFILILMRSKGKTLDEVAKKFDVSRERIRQIEEKFYRQIREYHEASIN